MGRARSASELASAGVCGFLAILTFAVHDWIEIAFGVNPDGGAGTAELATAVVLAAVSVALMSDVLRIHRLQQARA